MLISVIIIMRHGWFIQIQSHYSNERGKGGRGSHYEQRGAYSVYNIALVQNTCIARTPKSSDVGIIISLLFMRQLTCWYLTYSCGNMLVYISTLLVSSRGMEPHKACSPVVGRMHKQGKCWDFATVIPNGYCSLIAITVGLCTKRVFA